MLQDIQSRGALQDPRCGPLIGLMDQLGLTRCRHFLGAAFPPVATVVCTCLHARFITTTYCRQLLHACRPQLPTPSCLPLPSMLCRAESHRHVLQAASRELLSRINAMQPDRLLQLLEVGGAVFMCCNI